MSSQIYWANQSMSQFVKFKDLWIVCFSQPVLPWLQQIWGRGVDHFQWLIVGWGKCGFDKKGQKSIWILCCPVLQKYLFQRCNLTVLWCQKMQQQQILLQWFFCCCCSAGWMRHCKMRQEETEATVAGFQDYPGWERKNPQGLMLVAVGGAAASIKAGGGLLRA